MRLGRSTWKRAFAIILLTFVGLWLLALPAGHVMAWYTAKETVGDYPFVALSPKSLDDTRIAGLGNGITISRFGYSFQVPWTKTKSVQDWKSLSLFTFDDGSHMVIEDPATYADLLTPTDGGVAGRNDLRQLMGDEAVRSHYDYAKAAFSATPDEISLFHSGRRNARTVMLLTMKMSEVPEGYSAIRLIAAPHLRGFQFGDPGKVPTTVKLLMFDERDRVLRLMFKGPKGGTLPMLTQEQINAIVASIKAPEGGCLTPGHCV